MKLAFSLTTYLPRLFPTANSGRIVKIGRRIDRRGPVLYLVSYLGVPTSMRIATCCCTIAFSFWALMMITSPLKADSPAAERPTKFRVYIGTYTGKSAKGLESKGIYACELDLATGKLSEPALAAELANPSFLSIHPSGKFIYAVGEIGDFQGKKAGAVSALEVVDTATGKLKLLNQQPSGGPGPCHVSIDKTGRCALAANYGGGSVCSLPIQADGRLGEPASVIQHAAGGADPNKRKDPHAHSIFVDPANHYAFAPDLGLDKVLIYKLDPSTAKLTANDPPAGIVAAGSGPRHFAFHPSAKWAYVINETANTVTAFEFNPHHGILKEIQTITTLPSDAKVNSYTAEVVVHPAGKFLYGSNRGHNSIAVFAIDEHTGKLTAAGHQAKEVSTPRNFNIDPTGQFCLVCNQDADSVIVFKIDQQTGALQPTAEKIAVGMPVCVKFWPLGK